MPDEEHDDVRAWLAADPTPTMPDDVAARVHAALDRESQARGEISGPVAASAPATVTPLRRPGRWKSPLLAAAGIVAVIAIAVPVVNQESGSSDDAGSADGGSASSLHGDQSSDSAGEAAPGDKTSGDSNGITGVESPPLDLRRDSFDTDVRAYVGNGDVEAYRSSPQSVASIRCVDGVPTSPHGIDARLDGDPAQLLASPVGDGRTRVRAVVCGTDGPEVVARATVR
ncbi:hypothetical protein [Solicola gregarius]|uniref:Uncharacterized protein n=1 Tax=Solicola gregarius TaxID=2908642 RepID=A0AA46TL83_9ACTN|nr:hypothetical protein [Solicola gregarius]UYM07357.1 hypothetical protein L0C25_09870 [Solicola gregarius]